MIHEEQLKIIQNLMLKYKETKEEYLFKQILERIDDALIGMVCKIAKTFYFTAPNIQDLYQSGIIGVYRTIDSINETDNPKWILQRIFIYVRKEIFQEYKEKGYSFTKLKDRVERCDLFPVDENLIQEERIQFLSSLIINKVIDENDLKLLILKFVEKEKMQNIINLGFWGKTWITVNKRINVILNRIQKHIPDGTLI
jgi:hypothetical protein